MAGNTYGRQVVIPLTNKSGGGVIAGDVVIVDTSNNEAFTTTTTAGVTGGVGIAQETIASNATGRVLLSGYAALVNVNASVTRGNFGKTHTVAKQATNAGASRGTGTFCQFLTGGTTPTGRVFSPDLAAAAGNVASDAIWDAAGDLVQGTGADTAAKLTLGAAGTVVRSTGSTNAYAFPPGYEFDYAQITSAVVPSATSEATATTIVTGNAVTYDGSTVVLIEFSAPNARPPNDAASRFMYFVLYDGSSSIGLMGFMRTASSGSNENVVRLARRLTPSAAAHTYGVRAYITSGGSGANVQAGAGGVGVDMPAFIRITKV